MLLSCALAAAATVSTDFSSDSGGWNGGTLVGGALQVGDGSTTLELGPMSSFTFTARVRVVEGERLDVLAGDADLAITYGAAGGISLGTSVLPFAVADLDLRGGEIAWSPTESWESAGLSDPDAWVDAAGTHLCATAIGDDGVSRVACADTLDGVTWTRAALFQGAAPDVVAGAAETRLYYGCEGSICLARGADLGTLSEVGIVLAPDTDVDAGSIGSPSVVADAAGGWHLWYADEATGSTVYATSADGLSWTRVATIAADASRLGQVDVTLDAYGFGGTFEVSGAVGWTTGGVDPTFAGGNDRVPLLAASELAWSGARLDGASWIQSAGARTLYAATDLGIARFAGVAEPGDWSTVRLGWDGSTLSASWDDGPELTTGLAAASAMTLSVVGTLEISEASMVYEPATADTIDTGDTGDTGASGPGDTADTGDTAAEGLPGGDGQGSAILGAAQVAHEPGGYCGVPGVPAAAPLAVALIASARRRDRVRA